MDHDTKTLSAIKRIELEAAKMSGTISLAQGIPYAQSHPIIREAVAKAVFTNQVDKYSLVYGISELRDFLHTQYPMYDPTNEMLITNGAMEGLAATLFALLSEGDEVVVPTPAFPNYFQLLKRVRAIPVPVPLLESSNWELDLPAIQASISPRTKAIIVCNPNNPTGTIYTKDELLQLAKITIQHNLWLIADDVYQDFVFEEKEVFDLAKLPALKSNLIKIVSLSKNFALSGWRVGYLLTDRTIMNQIIGMHDALTICAPVVSQYAALAALSHKDEIVKPKMRVYAKNREILLNGFAYLSNFVSFTPPSGAYYFFPKIKNGTNDEDLAVDILRKVGVAVVPGSGFNIGGESHLRLCFGRPTSDVSEAMGRLEEYFLRFF